MNDGKAAIPLLKDLEERLPSLSVRVATMDAGYDHLPIYQKVHKMGAHSVIAYNPRNEQKPDRFDEHLRPPACVSIRTVTTATIRNIRH